MFRSLHKQSGTVCFFCGYRNTVIHWCHERSWAHRPAQDLETLKGNYSGFLRLEPAQLRNRLHRPCAQIGFATEKHEEGLDAYRCSQQPYSMEAMLSAVSGMRVLSGGHLRLKISTPVSETSHLLQL